MIMGFNDYRDIEKSKDELAYLDCEKEVFKYVYVDND